MQKLGERTESELKPYVAQYRFYDTTYNVTVDSAYILLQGSLRIKSTFLLSSMPLL